MKLRQAIAPFVSCCVTVVFLSGCMTSLATVKRAQGKYLWPQPSGTKSSDRKPNPAYYGMLAVTIPFDVVTSPAQLPFFIMWVTLPESEFLEPDEKYSPHR